MSSQLPLDPEVVAVTPVAAAASGPGVDIGLVAGPVSTPLTVRVLGLPAPQGSKSAFRNKYTGRIQQVESSKKVKPWREAVKSAVTDVIGDGWVRIEGPVRVHVTFVFPRPKAHFRTGRNAHLLREDAPTYAVTRGDLDKLLRSTGDALTDAGVWRDDRQVAHVSADKVYESPDNGLPGALLAVWAL